MAKNDSPIAWYGNLKSGERRTFWACFGGWTLDALNYHIFLFAFPAIAATFAISRAETDFFNKWITWPLIASALGGFAAAAFSDRFGRVRVLQITILWFALFTLLCAFAQNDQQFLIFRTLIGFGLGGEWAVGAVLLGETIGAKDRGKVVGAMQSGWGFGWGIAAIVSIFFLVKLVLLLKLNPDIAWRILLCLGILPALLVFYIRRHIDDAPVFQETQKKLAAKKQNSNFLEIFSPSMLKATILTTLLATGVQGGSYATSNLLDLMGKGQKIAFMGSRWYLTGLIVASILGYLVSAYLNDRIGRRRNFVLFAACSAAGIFALTLLPLKDASTIVLVFVLLFFVSGTYSGVGPVLTENFPTRIRGAGQGFAYNSGRLIAFGAPWTMGVLSAKSSMSQSIDLVALIAYGLVILAALLLPETNGKKLSAG